MIHIKVDLEKVRQRLQQIKNSTAKQTNLYKPKPGKTQIRILPYKFQPDYPFIELFFHYDLGKKPILSPSTFGEPDPCIEYAEQLKRTGSKEDWLLSKKLEPKMRVFAPVVIRGEENDGAKFWGFGKTVYQELLTIIDDTDYGTIYDPIEGRDLTIEFIPAEDTGKSYPDTKILVKPKITPLTENAELMKKLLENQKDINDIYTKPSYDELKAILLKWLNPEPSEEDAGDDVPTPNTSTDEGNDDGVPARSTKKTPKKVVEGVEDVGAAFDELFAEADGSKK